MAAAVLLKKQKKKEKYSLSDLKALGNQLLSSRAHINNLPLLLPFISASSPPQYSLEALLSLQSFFTPVLPNLPPSSSKPKPGPNSGQDDPEFIYRTWLRSKFDEFVNSLIEIAVSPECEEALREVALDTIMEFVKAGNGGRFHSAIYHKFLQSIVHSALGIDILLDLLALKYFKYTDICYFTYISLEKLARTLEVKDISDRKFESSDGNNDGQSITRTELSVRKIYYILSHIPPLESVNEKNDFEMWNGSGFYLKEDGNKNSEPLRAENKQQKTEKSRSNVFSVSNVAKKMKWKFTKAWIAFLRLQLPLDVYKEVLVTLHQAVIPHLSNPILLCDFLTRSYDIGGVTSVMALSSLFILMTQHGLEYPNFYEKLYALLVPSIFMAKHRAKFFELVDSCLKSPLLPAYLAAAFAKKLSRLSLTVPPSGALVIIALIHNLLRRHPSISCLVHLEDGNATATDDSGAGKESESCSIADMFNKKLGIDHFRDEENNPLKTDAMRSSLWEIDTLRHHCCPPVSRFVVSLENDLTVRSKTTEVVVKDFSSGSYATIFKEEIGRRVKQVPLAFYKATPTSLFSEADFAGWTFKCKENEESVTGSRENRNAVELANDEDSFAKRQRIESP